MNLNLKVDSPILRTNCKNAANSTQNYFLIGPMLSFFVTFATKHFLPPHVEEVTQTVKASETDSFRNVFTQTVKATTSLKESTSKAREWRWRRRRRKGKDDLDMEEEKELKMEDFEMEVEKNKKMKDLEMEKEERSLILEEMRI